MRQVAKVMICNPQQGLRRPNAVPGADPRSHHAQRIPLSRYITHRHRRLYRNFGISRIVRTPYAAEIVQARLPPSFVHSVPCRSEETMDGSSFDTLTRLAAADTSRRGALRSALASVLAGFAAAWALYWWVEQRW
jgi:hypothetical protein